MSNITTYGKLKKGDLFVSCGNPDSGYFSRVIEKGGQFSQFFNTTPTIFPGVITTPEDAKVVRVYEKPFREVAVGHLFIPLNEGMPVIVGISTLYKKTSEGVAAPLANFKEPLATELFHGHEKVIDFGDAYKIRVKVELELEQSYGDEM